MIKARAYLRVSHDRSGGGLAGNLSIETQRDAIRELCQRKGYQLTGEYSDIDISGSLDETSRLGLNEALQDAKARQYQVLVAYDTSRFSRGSAYTREYLRHDFRKHGVAVEYVTLPSTGVDSHDEYMETNFAAFDRLTSAMAREKCLLAQRALAKSGWRVSGSAPFGTVLHHVMVNGAKRTTLRLDPEWAPKVQAFMKMRAASVPRQTALEKSGLWPRIKQPTAVGLEKNALVYANKNVWFRHGRKHPSRESPTRTMLPRDFSEWVIEDLADGFPPLITEAEAMRILDRLPTKTRARKRTDRGERTLLAGMLKAKQDHFYFHLDREIYYRAALRKRIRIKKLDDAVRMAVAEDLTNDAVLAQLVEQARTQADAIVTDAQTITEQIESVRSRRQRLLDALESGRTSSTVVDRIAQLEEQERGLAKDLELAAEREQTKDKLRAFDPRHLQAYIEFMDDAKDQAELRRILKSVIKVIEYDEDNHSFQIEYGFPLENIDWRARRDSNSRPSGS